MPGPMSAARLTGEQYIAVLLGRQADYVATHPGRRYPPLLEWFVRDGDEDLVDLSAEDIPPEPEADDDAPDDVVVIAGLIWAAGYTPAATDVAARQVLAQPNGALQPGESWGGVN
jgi:hypothetical protein